MTGDRPIWVKALLLYLAVFLTTGVFFGLMFLIQGDARGAVFAGGISGLLFSAVLGTTTVVRQRHNTGSWSARQHVTVPFPGPLDHAHNQLACAFAAAGARVEMAWANEIRAVTGASALTWGSRIRIVLTPDSGVGVLIDITCRPRTPLAPLDYGESARTVAQIRHFLTPTPFTDGAVGPPGVLVR